MKRSFDFILKKGHSLPKEYKVEHLTFDYLPFLTISVGNPKKPHCYISGGIHGNEPSGTVIIMEYLSHLSELSNWHFLVMPCLNVWGYINCIRRDRNKNDLNRGFTKHPSLPVCQYIEETVSKYRPLLAIDMHTDPDCKNFSVFETFQNPKNRFSFNELESLVKIDKRLYIDGLKAENGIIYSRKEEATLECFCSKNGSPLSMTPEIPGALFIYDQVILGKLFLDLLFKKILPKKLV